MKKWNLNSWTKYPAKHLPAYQDKKELDMVLGKLKKYPPLVFAGETRSLKKSLAQVVDGKAFLLQGGDCAESFAEFHPDNIRDTLKAILQMSLVLTYSAAMPVVKVGRIAGQFSKPRSSPVEKKGDKELPSYLGDNINGMEFTEKARVPDAKRLFRAYSQAASTLNLIRAFSQGGFADLRQVHLWNLGFVNDKTKIKYKEIEDRISDALSFMEACGINPETNRKLRTVNFYTSHEALHLPFEEVMTRVDSTTGEYHDTSAHFVWIGDRTRQPDGAHVEFCRGIENPIGIKCGPTLKPEELIKLCNIINPKNEPGKITLISRFGANKVEDYLPKLIKSSAFKVGPHLIPIGFSIPLQNSTCPPSSCLVLSPIQTKCADVSWFSPVVESVLVIDSSKGKSKASCEVQKLTVFNLLLKSELIPHASINAKAFSI